MAEEIHDMSRVDSFMASRRRAMFFHSVWKPMLAGAVGAAIMTAAVIGSVWVILPKISTREVVVEHVIQKDVPFDNHVPQEKPFDNYVPHSKPFDVPAPTPKPVAAAPPDMGPQSPYAAKTPEENKFVDKPEYKDAAYRGRVVKSKNGRDLDFADGNRFNAVGWDNATQKAVPDPSAVINSDPFVGDLAMCVVSNKDQNMWTCTALHDGKEVVIRYKPRGTSAGATPQPSGGTTPPATNMVNVGVDVGYGLIEAMVDTGCSWPMAMPSVLADELLKRGLAIRAGSSKAMHADGSAHDVDVIMINSITVDGRVLHGVEASVSPSAVAPVLLGLGALNRLGPYSIEEGRLVFTSEQPA